jgi:hypothetical protein
LAVDNKIGGYIGYFNLVSWWNELSDSDRKSIIDRFQPGMGSEGISLTAGELKWTSESAAGFLADLASWFYKPFELYLARIIITEAERSLEASSDVVAKFRVYAQKSAIFFKSHECQPLEGHLMQCIDACEKHIALGDGLIDYFKMKRRALPSHEGYERLINIRLEQGDFKEVVRLVDKALSEGWAGKWERFLDFEEEED